VVPLVVGMVWLGLYPKPVLDRMEASANHYLQLARPGLETSAAPAIAAETAGNQP